MLIMISVWALKILSYVIIGDAVMSWLIAGDRFPRNVTSKITEPLYRPVHRILNPARTGGIDLAPLVWIFGIQALISFIGRLG